MIEEMKELIIDNYFNGYQDKINKKESLTSYYNKVTKEDLKMTLGLYTLIKDDVRVLDQVPIQEENTKEEMIQYLIENISEFYFNILSIQENSFVFQLDRLIKAKGHYKQSSVQRGLKYSIEFIIRLKKFHLAQVNYQKELGQLEIQIPVTLLEELKKILANKNFKKENDEYNEVIYNVKKLLNVYGVLPLDKLTKIMKQVFTPIQPKKIATMLRNIDYTNEDINIYGEGKQTLVGNIMFSDIDDAYTFYESLPEGEYKIFTEEEYEDIDDRMYHRKFLPYQELIEYLYSELEMSIPEVEQFEEWYILDYLSSYQKDIDVANQNLMKKLEKEFDTLKLQDKAFIKKRLSTLGNLYPNYGLKGYAIKEKELSTMKITD